MGIYRNGIFGVVVGDALGCPVQFESRETVATHPVTDMRGYGTFNLPEGSWTDDSSLTLALLDSINKEKGISLAHIADNFVKWLENGEFTPYGYSYDIGRGTMISIKTYEKSGNPLTCGSTSANNNGNGSLMRIMPCCLYCIEQGLNDDDAIDIIHQVSGITHGHIRSKIACGLYYFMAKSILHGRGTLVEHIQQGLDKGFAFYERLVDKKELAYYNRLRNISEFAKVDIDDIRSSGYVVDTIEAAVWSLITTNSYREALLKAVNLGLDTDTVGAVAGGLAGLFYGVSGDYGVLPECGIPEKWINTLVRNEWIEDMCNASDNRMTK